jgi:hypothetical protein
LQNRRPRGEGSGSQAHGYNCDDNGPLTPEAKNQTRTKEASEHPSKERAVQRRNGVAHADGSSHFGQRRGHGKCRSQKAVPQSDDDHQPIRADGPGWRLGEATGRFLDQAGFNRGGGGR